MILVYWVWRLGIWLTTLAPRRWSYAAAGLMGNGAYYLMSLRRSVAKENFSQVLGKSPNDPEVRRVARQSFRNYARYLRDVMIYSGTSTAEFEKRVVIHSREQLDRALALDKGAIIVSAHFGNMDMPSAVLASQFRPISLVGESLRPKQLMDFLTKMREDHNVHLYPYDRAPRKILEALKRHEMAAFLLDFGVTHYFDLATVNVRFFGTTTAFPAGPAKIALLTGAPIIVGFAHVDADGTIHVNVNEPIIARNTGNRHQDLTATMQEIASRFEEFIRQRPEQWYMFRPMWMRKTSARFKVRKPKYEGESA
jgi:lauroyl/myristoyl acyltransferase